MLYIPGISPKMLGKAGTTTADAVLLDLEDSVSPDKKPEARDLVADTLRKTPFDNITSTVRVNAMSTDFFMGDLEVVIPAKPDVIRIPKLETAEDVARADEIIADIEKKNSIEEGSIKLHAMIETAVAVENAYEIAKSSSRIDAITIGGQDLTADMGIGKTEEGIEILYARQRIVMAAKAARVACIDTVYADINNEEGLIRETKLIKDLGFDGKAVIHPKQIDPIHNVFNPTEAEIAKAKEILEAFEEHEKQGVGVFTIGSKMIDAPVVTRAKRILELSNICHFE